MNLVIKQDEYRQFALHCLELANTAASLADRAHLLRMAEAWLDLADRATRRPPRQAIAPGDRNVPRRCINPVHLTIRKMRIDGAPHHLRSGRGAGIPRPSLEANRLGGATGSHDLMLGNPSSALRGIHRPQEDVMLIDKAE